RSIHASSDSTSRGISAAYRKPDTRRQHHVALNGGMTSSEPARTGARRTRDGTATLYGPRRGRVLLGALLALFLVATAFATTRHLLTGEDRSYLSTDGWPSRGQGA